MNIGEKITLKGSQKVFRGPGKTGRMERKRKGRKLQEGPRGRGRNSAGHRYLREVG